MRNTEVLEDIMMLHYVDRSGAAVLLTSRRAVVRPFLTSRSSSPTSRSGVRARPLTQARVGWRAGLSLLENGER